MNPKIKPGQAVPSKRPISRWEKEWKKRRILAILVAVVIIAAVGIVSYGYYDKNVKPWHQPSVKVNGQAIDMRHFVKMLRLYGAADNPSQLAQIVQYAVSTLENNELVRQKAKEYGIDAGDISDVEIDEELRSQLGFNADSETEDEFQQRLKDILDAKGISRSDLEELLIIPTILKDKLFEAIGSNEFGGQYEHAQVKAVLLGTEEDALLVKADWAGDFNKIIKDYSPTRYYPKGGYWLVEVTEKTGDGDDEQLHIKAILLATKDKAETLRTQINNGADFATLTEENSIDSSASSGGDIDFMSLDSIKSKFGEDNLATIQALALNEPSDPISQNSDGPVEWLPASIESSTFDGFVFTDGSENSSVSDPVRDLNYTTKGGYWLVEVLDTSGDGDNLQLHIQAILLDSKAEAENLRTQINDGSADFADIAKEYSLNTSSRDNGGDLGSLGLSDVETKFGTDNLGTIQALSTGVISDPLYNAETSKQSGYWVIQVLAKDQRTLSENNQYSYSYNFFNTWAGEQTTKDYISDDYSKISWALDNL